MSSQNKIMRKDTLPRTIVGGRSDDAVKLFFGVDLAESAEEITKGVTGDGASAVLVEVRKGRHIFCGPPVSRVVE